MPVGEDAPGALPAAAARGSLFVASESFRRQYDNFQRAKFDPVVEQAMDAGLSQRIAAGSRTFEGAAAASGALVASAPDRDFLGAAAWRVRGVGATQVSIVRPVAGPRCVRE
jgi:hypothetical protein